MGICIEPPECLVGLEEFEQYQYRTQPEGKRSGPGDLDLVIYSLKKWAKLAAQGNPTVLLMLFAPAKEIVTINAYGRKLQASSELFLSRECGLRFKYYLQAQKERLLGERNQRTNRPELKAQYGFDTKFAYHAIRLGIQGTELLTTGTVALPMAEPANSWLTDLRVGEHSLAEAIDHIESLQYLLHGLSTSANLPERADIPKVSRWLVNMYQSWWAGHAAP